MDKNILKVYCNGIKKPVWIQEKQHRRGIKTPTAYRYGKSWEGSSGISMELLKRYRNSGIDIETALKTGRSVPGLIVV